MQSFKAEFWEPSLTLLCFFPSIFTWISNMTDNIYEMFSRPVLSSSISDAEFSSSKLCCNHLQVVFAVFSLLFHPLTVPRVVLIKPKSDHGTCWPLYWPSTRQVLQGISYSLICTLAISFILKISLFSSPSTWPEFIHPKVPRSTENRWLGNQWKFPSESGRKLLSLKCSKSLSRPIAFGMDTMVCCKK